MAIPKEVLRLKKSLETQAEELLGFAKFELKLIEINYFPEKRKGSFYKFVKYLSYFI